MKIGKKIGMFLLMLMGISACLFDTSSEKVSSYPVAVTAIQDIFIASNTITFYLDASVPSSGWEITTPEVVQDASTFQITVKGIPPSGPSLPAFHEVQTSVAITVEDDTTYRFRFWGFNDVWVDTTLTIPGL